MLDPATSGSCYLGPLCSAIANCSNQFDESLVQVIQPHMSDSSLATAHSLDTPQATLNSAHSDSSEFALQLVNQKNTRPHKSGDNNGIHPTVWYLDTGAHIFITENINLLTDLTLCDPVSIIGPNGTYTSSTVGKYSFHAIAPSQRVT